MQQESLINKSQQDTQIVQMSNNQLNLNTQENNQNGVQSDSQSDSVIDEQQQEQAIQRPKPQQIPMEECYHDDQIQDSSEDDVIENDDSMIDDSSQEEEKKQKQMKQMKETKEGQRQKYKPKDKKLILYDYQNILFNHSLNQNRIIYLPTGKGKTLVAIASMYYYLCKTGSGKKIVFLANTIQLVKQQADAIKRNLQRIMNDEQLAQSLRVQNDRDKVKWTAQQIRKKVCCIHGEKNDDIGATRRKKIEAELTSKKQMLEMFKSSTIIVMIAQMFLNCLRRGYIQITDFSFMVLDQCHHCHGNHPYAGIMRQFYFDPPKPDTKTLNKLSARQQDLKLPIIMGLTASPVMQQGFDTHKLLKQIEQLCGNLNSKFTSYEIDKIKSQTVIQVIKIQECQKRKEVPDLIAYFSKYKQHSESYKKIKTHFPQYFVCIKKVIDFLQSKYETYLGLQVLPATIINVQLLLFYDIKQCLLVKLRDIWLELGQYALSIAFQDLYHDLKNIRLTTEENKQILNQIIQIIKQYVGIFKQKFGKCQIKYFSGKAKKLIELLQNKTGNVAETVDKVVVFASKRRTVKYLQIIIQRYSETLPQQQKKYYQCKKVTGYSVSKAADYSKNQTIYQSDPSSFRFYAEVQNNYNDYLTALTEEQNRQNFDKKKFEDQSQSKNLASQLKRMRTAKCGKLLLEVQQKYSTQIQTIKLFKGKSFRVLITTSVTQQGFDIPQCKMVISFDEPSSLKSYIQIKGRARKQYSKYFIFASEINYKKMADNKELYDSIINATHQIAINRFSQKMQDRKLIPKIITQDQGYKRIIVKESGAVLNTRYGLQILKMFCASLRHPNKPRFYFIQTKNLAFRCLIYFPKTAPTSKPYIVGQSKQSKDLALKSAAFQAVKYLYQQKYIKADLRPKKYDQIQDQREIQKFEDLQQTRKNEAYKKIFQEQVRIRSENVTDRKFIRFYFKAIKSSQLDFPYINSDFKRHLPYFDKKQFPFQVYMMNFSNSRNMKQLQKDEQSQQIGVLTCFQYKYIDEIFSGYQYSFEENSNEKFTLKLQEEKLLLNKSQYQRLKRIHQFIVAGSLGRQVYHYHQLSQKKPVTQRWISQLKNDSSIQPETQRQFYPIFVILKKKNGHYSIDQNCNKNIQNHEKIFKQIYQLHNFAGKQIAPKKFHMKLNQQYEKLLSNLKMKNKEGQVLIQSLQKDHCFAKSVVSARIPFSQENQKSKKTLENKKNKLMLVFDHANTQTKELLKIIFWTKYKKEKKKQIFQRDGKLAFKDVQNSRLYLPSQFCLYPLTPALLFKCTLATQFLFKAVFQYSLAFQFRNKKLPSIFDSKNNNQMNKSSEQLNQTFSYSVYTNVILEYGEKIFKYLSDKSSSQYLRNIGKSYQQGSKFTKPNFQFSMSKSNMSIMNQSSIYQNNTQIVSDSLNISQLGLSNILGQTVNNQKSRNEQSVQKSENIASQIKITQILKVLTSRMYKFNKVDNYEQYEFIGDVVLKMLSTVQVFLQRPKADESQLHISRANIICNANLHRKAILKNLYRYILTKKRDQLAPPYRYTLLQNIDDTYYEKTSIKQFNLNTQIEGYHYIPGKVHADVVEGLIGAFYLHTKQLDHCQHLLYVLDILKKPNIKINYEFNKKSQKMNNLPALYSNFEDRIGYHFKNKGLLIQAFTHSSIKTIIHTSIDQNAIDDAYQNANKSFASQQSFLSADIKQVNKNIGSKIAHWQTFYQRFQFLGDSILDLIVVQYLHQKFGTKDQGTLSALKQAGVSNRTLGMIAINFGMHQLILMDYPQNDKAMKEFQKILQNYNHYLNNPEALMQAKLNSIKILGDVFQAFVGAIFIDLELNYSATKAVIMRMIKQFIIHYTDLETMKKTSTFKFQQFLNQNNYRECQLKKDVSQQIHNGNFKYLLVDRSGIIVQQCWESTQKRAWDLILQKFYQKNKATNQQLT